MDKAPLELHLRNRGFNTISSCHHEPEPYIQIDCQPEDLRMLWTVLTEMKLSSRWHLTYYFDGQTGFRHAGIQFARATSGEDNLVQKVEAES